MKYKWNNLTLSISIWIVLSLTINESFFSVFSLKSFLKIEIVESVNLHCKLNNEFHCNPYAVIDFKFDDVSRSTHRLECTKSPKWESVFTFDPSNCKEVITINFYQFLNPDDTTFLGPAIRDDNRFERGEINAGYLGRVILELEKVPFGNIDDWFMIESPIENDRLMFPSCVHLRIQWTSTTCGEPTGYSVYQINSLNSRLQEFLPRNFIPMCKKDFAMIYKTRLSKFDSENPLSSVSELDEGKKKCIRDPNTDYGFLHISNLTSIEESIVYKIVKRITGEKINYKEISQAKDDPIREVTNYKQFFAKECWKKYGLTIERVNEILKNEALDMLKNSTNPYVTINKTELDYPLKLARMRLDSVYNDTLEQFNVVDDLKSLDKMDDNTYLATMNQIAKTIHDMNAEYKTDETIFEKNNRVIFTNEGMVDPREMNFFKVFALYKWNGGHLQYDELKREYLLRKKLFVCYDLVKKMPPNIIFNFVEDVCPANHVCVDPNGIVINSIGKDPRIVWEDEIKSRSINFLPRNPKKLLAEIKKKSNQFRFKQKEEPSIVEVDKNDKEMLYFDTLVKSEQSPPKEESNPPIIPEENTNYMNKFDTKYFQRRTKIKRKKEIIINRIFDMTPLLGEVLAVANIDKLDNNINDRFLIRETNLIKKYLIMWDANCGYVEHASKVLLNLILCNTDPNKTRFLLNELMEGLCFGDDKSMKIFREIIITLLIDSLVNNKYHYFEDLQAKFNLLNTLNKGFCFKTITKIRFIQKMLLLDVIKEKLTFIILNNDSKEKVDQRIRELATSIPIQEGFPNNTREINFNDENKEAETMKRLFGHIMQKNNPSSIRFLDSGFKNMLEVGQKEKDEGENINFLKKNRKDNMFFKFKNAEDPFEEGDSHLKTTLENINKLRDKLSKELKEISNKTTISNIKLVKKITNNFKNVTNISHIKEHKTLLKNSSINTNNSSIAIINKPMKKKPINLMKSIINNGFPKFKSTENQDDNFADLSLSLLNNNDNSNDQQNKLAFRGEQINTHLKHIPLKKTFKNMPNSKEILDTIMEDSSTNLLIKKAKELDSSNKVLYPKEIHAQFKLNKTIIKKVTLNANNPTKKLILDKLMDKNSFNDLIGQQDKIETKDPTGLFNVLKNIQNRACSCGYICIEIGTIYGDFDMLNPKKVVIPTQEEENVHLIIKPIILVNSTRQLLKPKVKRPKKILPAPKPKQKPKPKVMPKKQNKTFPINKEEEDCDLLNLSPNYNKNMRFKEKIDKNKKLSKVKRKFYRKVQIENEVLATQVFKQGLNMIILQRDKSYKKLYERTFNTNNNPHEADEMAMIIRNTPCTKIIVITGIGKWMGAMTPALLREIKQIGGPNLNKLVTMDKDDNEMADHAFILIGRRGLCRYNGIFKVKNYDISMDLKELFPDEMSDPNDCYFEDVDLENEKNKHSEKQFFHMIDLRLTLNLNNDNRFAYNAPTVATVSPSTGSVHGGQEIKIGGFNFGKQTTDIKEIIVRGVVCGDYILLSPNIISCVTRASTIMGPGSGNVIIRPVEGLSSPSRTCNVFMYTGDAQESLDDLKQTVKTVKEMRNENLPIYLNSFHDQDIQIYDNLMYNKKNPEGSNKLPEFNEHSHLKVSNLVKQNYDNLLNSVGENVFQVPKDGFRKRRFAKLIEQLEPCDRNKNLR